MSPSEFPEDAGAYLAQLERELQPMPAEERAKILQEIGSHLAERAEVGAQMLHATIAQLGTPRALARSFLDDWALAGALAKGASPRILWVILRRAWRGLAAGVIGTVSVLLYLFAFAFLIVAVMKPVMPSSVGMWLDPNGGVSNFGVVGPPPHSGAELLGWWIIPISLAVAVVLWLMAGWVVKRGGQFLLRKPS